VKRMLGVPFCQNEQTDDSRAALSVAERNEVLILDATQEAARIVAILHMTK